jgi:primase-polymerase (primpol)-like protein
MPLARADARFCGTAHRVAAWRNRFPSEMTLRRAWVRADGKRPIQDDGRPASSTDASTWAFFPQVRSAGAAGDGFGIMLGDGLGCYDLDHVSDTDARAFIASIPEPIVYAERSMSGDGVHVFVEAAEGPGTRRTGVERYTRRRFIRVTGDRFAL